MEDVLDVYERPYDPMYPVVCMDEASRQLIEETKISVKPGSPERVDYEYRRCGVADLFVAFEPLAGKRVVEVTETRKRTDFARFLQELSDDIYANAEKIVLVMDNLNTHDIASLYAQFEPAEALRLAKRFEIHHTPKHASWLNMAEIEIGVLSRQCLCQQFSRIEDMRRHVRAAVLRRNSASCSVNWQFTTKDARIKLKKLYPLIVEN
jgi:hypothetical protein